jgi:tight adherence protein B
VSGAPAVIGVAASVLALLIGTWAIMAPGRTRLPMERRRPGVEEGPGLLHGATTVATNAIERALQKNKPDAGAALDRAGITMRPQDLTLLAFAGMLVAGALGLLMSGPMLGILLAALVPVVVKLRIEGMATARQRAFADQLDSSLQLMASGLRAGHSLPQALAAVAREAEKPTSEEFARVINETRVGRDMNNALADAANRMKSEDFAWVTQAIGINREVGGNLADVLDGVSQTIRERNQIRRQVKALSAEGRLSGIVLMVLPIGICGFLLMTNPSYMLKFTESAAGYAMIVMSIILLLVGGLWMRKTVSIKF